MAMVGVGVGVGSVRSVCGEKGGDGEERKEIERREKEERKRLRGERRRGKEKIERREEGKGKD